MRQEVDRVRDQNTLPREIAVGVNGGQASTGDKGDNLCALPLIPVTDRRSLTTGQRDFLRRPIARAPIPIISSAIEPGSGTAFPTSERT